MSSEPSVDTRQLAEAVTREHALDALSTDLKTLLAKDRKYVDEAQAKKLRKQWDQLSVAEESDDERSAAVRKQFDTLRDRIHDQVERRNKKFAELEQQLTDLKEAIRKDDLQTSQQLEQKIIKDLNQTKGLSAQRQQSIIQGLEALQPKIKKLVSWRHWGTVKAREQVIEEIKTLHDTEKDLEKIARRIKQAREEWKQWDNSGEGGDKKLYKAFDEACTKAYEPCRKLFETQRKQREAASKHRVAVCEALEQHYEKTDWREPDWKAITTLLREQSARWRKLGPAEFRDRKPLQKRYDAIMERFDGPLDRERKRNLRDRQEVIESAQKLATLDDNRRAINELQKLKKQWVVTVSGKRKIEQSVWKQFTAACDAVYERGRESRKAFESELKDNLKLRRTLIAEIDAVNQSTDEGSDLSTLGGQISAWRKRWKEIGQSPKAEAKKVEDQFRKAIGAAEKQVSSRKRAAQADQDRRLMERAALCAELEAQVIEQDSGVGEAAVAALEDQWTAQESLIPELEKQLSARFAKALAATNDQAARKKLLVATEQHFEQINNLLLQLEIRTEVDSPAEFARERMALQINRLSAAMGKGGDEPDLDTPALVARIHTTGAVKPVRQAQIDQRFQLCFKALNQ